MSAPVTASDIRVALEGRFPSNSHALMFEVRDSAGYSARRSADAVAVGLWPSRGHKIEGIEIKVSRGDFLHEMKHPEKSEAVLQFCHHWWLATPAGLVKPEELPLTWGLLELTKAGLRVRKQAPELEPIAPDVSFVACMLRRRAGLDHEGVRREVESRVAETLASHEERMKRVEQEVRARALKEAATARENIQTVVDETGIDLTRWRAGDDIVMAVKSLMAVNAAGGGWSGTLSSLAKDIAALQDTLARLGFAARQEEGA